MESRSNILLEAAWLITKKKKFKRPHDQSCHSGAGYGQIHEVLRSGLHNMSGWHKRRVTFGLSPNRLEDTTKLHKKSL